MYRYPNQIRLMLIAFIFILTSLTNPIYATFPGEIFIISDNPDEESHPSIHGDTVVWQTLISQYGDYDITGANIHDLHEIQIFEVAKTPRNEILPDIWDNLVIYEINQGYPDWDIAYGVIESPTNIDRHNILDQSVLDSHRPRICGTTVAWSDYHTSSGDWDPTLVDINDLDEPNYINLNITYDDELYVDLDPNVMVWNLYDPDWGSSLWGASLWTEEPETFYTFMEMDPNAKPAVSGDWVVAQSPEGGVIADNLFDPLLPEQISDSNDTAAVAIADHIVVWQDLRNGQWDLYGYNLNTKTEFPIVIQTGDQVNPAIAACGQQAGYWIIWEDYTTDPESGDIHGIWLNGPEVALEAPEPEV